MNDFMNFDFPNYTFSAIISVFAAIIGLAFPFILQMTHRFQDIYKTDNVIDWFTDEKRYKQFLWWLKFSIPVMVLFPFTLLLVKGCDWVIITLLTFQTGVAATLMCRLVLLYYLVIDYSSSKKLTSRTSMDDAEKLVHLMLISDNNRNQEAYNTAKEKVYRKITDYFGKASYNISLSFQEDVAKVIRQMLEASCEKEKYPWISKDTTIVFLLYDSLTLSEQIYKIIWETLNGMVKSRNEVWLQSYWNVALQYAMFMKNHGMEKRNLDHFKQLHIFYGALLLGAGYDDMLRYILTFRNATPEPSPLLPSTEKEIFGSLIDKDKLRSKPFRLSNEYPMFFLPLDVRSDERIYNAFVDYLALSLFLLPQNQSCYGEQNFQIPRNLDKEELNYLHELVNSYKSHYEKIAKEFAKYLPDSSVYAEYFENGKQIINRVLADCKKELDEVENNDEIDSCKVEKLRQSLISTYSKMVFPFRSNTNKHGDWEVTKATLCVHTTLSPGLVMKRQHVKPVNFEGVVVDIMLHQIYANVARIFLLNKPAVSYYIQYRDILEAFDKLNVDDTYILLSNGVNLWNYGRGRKLKTNIEYKEECMSYKGMEIKSIGSGNEELFIMKKENIPYFTIGNSEEKNGLKLLDPGNKLYWIKPTLENRLSMTLYQTIIFHIPVPFKYIRLNISYDTAKGEFDLKKIKDIRHYMV